MENYEKKPRTALFYFKTQKELQQYIFERDINMVTLDTINEWFSYHPPDDKQIIQLQAIREKAKELAITIYQNTPSCPDQTTAIRKLREAVMTANAAIALKGR